MASGFFVTSRCYLLHRVKPTQEQGAAHRQGPPGRASVCRCPPSPRGLQPERLALPSVPACVWEVGRTSAFTSADTRKTSARWRWKATNTLVLQHILSLTSAWVGRMAGLLLPLQTTRFSVRYLNWPKHYFTGANIRFCYLKLLALTRSNQTDHFYPRNVPPHLLQCMSYDTSFYSGSSHERFAKMKLFVCITTTKEIMI